MGKLNTQLNMSTARHPRTDGSTERVNQTMQTLLRGYCSKFGVNWTSHLSMVDFFTIAQLTRLQHTHNLN